MFPCCVFVRFPFAQRDCGKGREKIWTEVVAKEEQVSWAFFFLPFSFASYRQNTWQHQFHAWLRTVRWDGQTNRCQMKARRSWDKGVNAVFCCTFGDLFVGGKCHGLEGSARNGRTICKGKTEFRTKLCPNSAALHDMCFLSVAIDGKWVKVSDKWTIVRSRLAGGEFNFRPNIGVKGLKGSEGL